MLNNNSIARDVWDAWRAPVPPPAVDWIPANVRIPSDTESPGAFDLDLVPHVLGVLEAVDDPEVRVILLRWATRNAKTTTGVAILVYYVVTQSPPTVFASCDEARADDTIGTVEGSGLLVPMLMECAAVDRSTVRTHQKRGVLCGTARIRKAYAGSPGTLAGYPARIGLANEGGLWSLNMLRRLLQRGKLFAFDSKFLIEGKPEAEGECAVSAMVKSETTQRRYRYVKCPHCGMYQRLQWGWGKAGPGVKWDKPTGGRTDPNLAVATAHYECVKGCRIEDVDRVALIQTGQWVAEGQKIDSLGRLTGKPLVPPSTVAFDGLSTLYSLAISGWSQIVSEFFDCRDDPDALREFITGTLAEQYDPTPQVPEAHELAVRLLSDDHPERGVCPAWSAFLTTAMDVGSVGSLLVFYWQVCAWGRGPRGGVIDWGISEGEESFLKLLPTLSYRQTDGVALRPLDYLKGFDSGDGDCTDEVYRIASTLQKSWPLKGDSYGVRNKSIDLYTWGHKRNGRIASRQKRQKKIGLGDLLIINTHRTQSWRIALMEGRRKSDAPEFVSMPADCLNDWESHADYLDQLAADVLVDGRYIRSGDNEAGDMLRYNRALAELHIRRSPYTWETLINTCARKESAATGRKPRRKRNGKNFATSGGGRDW